MIKIFIYGQTRKRVSNLNDTENNRVRGGSLSSTNPERTCIYLPAFGREWQHVSVMHGITKSLYGIRNRRGNGMLLLAWLISVATTKCTTSLKVDCGKSSFKTIFSSVKQTTIFFLISLVAKI